LADPVTTLFASLNQTATIKRRSDQLRSTQQGVQLVVSEISNLFETLESRVSEIRGELTFPIEKSTGSYPRLIKVSGPGFREREVQRILTLAFEIRNFAVNSVAATTLKRAIYFENYDAFGHFLNVGLIEEKSYSPTFVESDQVMWLDKNQNSH